MPTWTLDCVVCGVSFADLDWRHRRSGQAGQAEARHYRWYPHDRRRREPFSLRFDLTRQRLTRQRRAENRGVPPEMIEKQHQ